MTTIAWDGYQGILATDGRTTKNTIILSDKTNKIKVFKSIKFRGDLLLAGAFCGNCPNIDALVTNINEGRLEQYSQDLDCSGIIIGKRFIYNVYGAEYGVVQYPKKIYSTMGSGADIAFSALHLGLGAIGAIKHAIKLDSASGGKINTWWEGK